MSPPTVMRIFSGNSYSLRTAKQCFVLCMHIIRVTQFFQQATNSQNLAFFVSSECELKPRFSKLHCCWCCPATPTFPGKSNAEATYVSAQIKTSVFAARMHHTTICAPYSALGHRPFVIPRQSVLKSVFIC